MRDVEKTSIPHQTNSKRSRRRRRGRSGYIFLVIVIAVAVMVTLSMTVFFNIKTIRVTGNADSYTAEDVVNATGIAVGDNLVRLKTDEAEQRAIEALIHVESIDIVRKFPDTLEIQVQKCTPAYNVVYEYGTLIVSEHGRILDNSMDPQPGLVRIVGYNPSETTPGKQIAAVEERYDKVFSAFRDLIYEGDLTAPIVEIDMSDYNDIMVNFDNRIIFDMGNWSEISYKISFAEQIIAKQPADKEGYLVMVGTNQVSFRNKADYEATRKAAKEAANPKPTEAATTSAEDASDTEDADGETPETEAAPEDTTEEIYGDG